MKNKKYTHIQRTKILEAALMKIHNRQQAILHKLEMIKQPEEITKTN